LDFKKNKIIARSVNEEKNNLALKIIPELINSEPRLGISGSFIELNQIFEKKNAMETPNKIKILIIHKYERDQLIWPVFIGEVAYKEKKIAMSYTKKEVICSKKQWVQEFESL